MNKKYELGPIELGQSVYVSDPCYDVGVWCQKLLTGLKPGTWYGFMNKRDDNYGWGIRVSDLWIAHEDNKKCWPNKLVRDADIGVDSVAAGIYDEEYFKKYHTIPEGKFIDDSPETKEWYNRQFVLRYYYDIDNNIIVENDDVERRDGIALDNKCVISFSGYGDGSYSLYISTNSKGEIVGVRIKFI